MSIVVSDASPLINLARVQQFELLAAFYGQVIIPQAVYDEVVVRGQGREGSAEVESDRWGLSSLCDVWLRSSTFEARCTLHAKR